MNEGITLLIIGFLLAAAPSCDPKHRDMTIGEAESKAADIFGLRAYCTGDRDGWTCFEVTNVVDGHITYAPAPVVTCRDGKCHKFHSDQTTMESR